MNKNEINPGSSEEFARINEKYFAVQGAEFAKHVGLVPVVDLTSPAKPDVIALTNSQPPTPEI